MRGAEFLSTPSVRRATASQVRPPKLLDISIHALREEGDCLIVRQRGPAQDFYPRPPRGGRLQTSCDSSQATNFYPRPPRGGRPRQPIVMRFHGYFYPRPPRGGRRSAPLFRPSSRNYFYPRPPRGGRRQARSGRQVAQDISIHALREEGDYTVQIVHVGAVISIHALREEGDGSFSQFILDLDTFLSTPSARRATNGSSRCRPA